MRALVRRQVCASTALKLHLPPKKTTGIQRNPLKAWIGEVLKCIVLKSYFFWFLVWVWACTPRRYLRNPTLLRDSQGFSGFWRVARVSEVSWVLIFSVRLFVQKCFLARIGSRTELSKHLLDGSAWNFSARLFCTSTFAKHLRILILVELEDVSACGTRKHVFLFHKKTRLLVPWEDMFLAPQEGMSSASTRRDFLLNKNTRLLV